MITVENLCKSFILHNQNKAILEVVKDASFYVNKGESVALIGESGSGKSSVMRMIYGNYLANSGRILIDGVDLVTASAHQILKLRKNTIGYVSQFLRVVPRVPTLEVVAEPLLQIGKNHDEAIEAAKTILTRVNIPERLWALSPMTFSGGEQQRVNIARGFVRSYPIFLLDEPTASLDATNREVVIELIKEAKENGSSIVGIFHDVETRNAVIDREIDVTQFSPQVKS